MTLQKSRNLWHSEFHPSLPICLLHATLLPPAPHSFILAFLHSAVRSAVHSLGPVPKHVSHTSPCLLPDWFSHTPRPFPATTATQLSPVSFVVGMRAGLLWLRIELWESCAGGGSAQHQVSQRMNSWVGKNLGHMGTCQWHLSRTHSGTIVWRWWK